MISKEIEQGLTRGLLSGYAGETKFTKISRGSFDFNSSHLESDGMIYHDEWLRASVGGGQDLLKIDDQKFTRLYAGGVVKDSTLSQLGITEKDVVNQLKASILELKSKTRLLTNCHPDPQGEWQYAYVVIETDFAIPITIAKETISYQNTVVFVHDFLLCPIR